MEFQCLMRITDFLIQWEQTGKHHVKEKLIPNITLQKLVRKQREKYEKLQKNDFLSVSSMSTEHMQLSEPESSQNLDNYKAQQQNQK